MSRVGLIGENSIEYINLLLDIWNNNDCAVLLDCRIPLRTSLRMLKEANVRKCYIESRFSNKSMLENIKDIEFISFDRKNNTAEKLSDEIYNKFKENYSKSEAIILYSSGTTGKAKGIILSHFAINTNADAIIDYMKPSTSDCFYVCKALSHSSAITGELLVALKTNTPLIIAPTVVPPRFVLNSISKFNITILFSNPTLLSLYADECIRKSYNLSSLKTIYVSGSILNENVYKKAHTVFNGIAIYNVYGLSEAGPRVTAQRTNCCNDNSVGKVISGIELIIVDEKGTPVKQGEKGIIHIKTPCLFNGYVSGKEKLPALYSNWFNTGDIGYIDEYDEIHITDRQDDMFIINTHKIYPSEIEQRILKLDGVEDCAVAQFQKGDNYHIGCLYVSNQIINLPIRKFLQEQLLPYEIPTHFVKVNKIPTNIRGKKSIVDIQNILSLNCEKEIIP